MALSVGTVELPNWYGTSEQDLQQGDLMIDFPALVTSARASGDWGLTRRRSTFAVLTQSCDIRKERQQILLLVPVVTYEGLKVQDNAARASNYKTALVQGTAIAEFLLPPLAGSSDWLVALFRNVISVPKDYVTGIGGERVSLVSPYREHFAQGYARFVMRVGLPSGLERHKLP